MLRSPLLHKILPFSRSYGEDLEGSEELSTPNQLNEKVDALLVLEGIFQFENEGAVNHQHNLTLIYYALRQCPLEAPSRRFSVRSSDDFWCRTSRPDRKLLSERSQNVEVLELDITGRAEYRISFHCEFACALSVQA